MPDRILDRDEYSRLIDKHFDAAKSNFLEWITLLCKDDFKQIAMRRFDEGGEKYGPCDLTSRDWQYEADAEGVDGIAYNLFDVEASLRDL